MRPLSSSLESTSPTSHLTTKWGQWNRDIWTDPPTPCLPGERNRGEKPQAIQRLWIEIPLKDREVPLLHTVGDGLRQNYAGAVPAGQGAIWDGTKAHRDEPWRNAFVPYSMPEWFRMLSQVRHLCLNSVRD